MALGLQEAWNSGGGDWRFHCRGENLTSCCKQQGRECFGQRGRSWARACQETEKVEKLIVVVQCVLRTCRFMCAPITFLVVLVPSYYYDMHICRQQILCTDARANSHQGQPDDSSFSSFEFLLHVH
jgi:hypothetical protein